MSSTVPYPALSDLADAIELRFVLNAARALLDRIDTTGASEATQRHLGALADDLDAVCAHPTTTMAAEVGRHLNSVANPDAAPAEGMTVGQALQSMARLGFYDPKLLAS